MYHTKIPLPVFTTFDVFKAQVNVWKIITDIDENKQGSFIVIGCLPQFLKEIVLDKISVEDIHQYDGLCKVMSVLEDHFASQ